MISGCAEPKAAMWLCAACRNALWREILGQGASPRSRHPLRRHLAEGEQRRIHLCNALLRARASREFNQAAQGANRFGPHELPFAACQPVPTHSAHRCLLAAAGCSRLHPLLACLAENRVRQHPPASFENRRPHRRDGQPHPGCACFVLPRGRAVQPPCVPTAEIRAMNGGACRPWSPYHQPPTR